MRCFSYLTLLKCQIADSHSRILIRNQKSQSFDLQQETIPERASITPPSQLQIDIPLVALQSHELVTNELTIDYQAVDLGYIKEASTFQATMPTYIVKKSIG